MIGLYFRTAIVNSTKRNLSCLQILSTSALAGTLVDYT